MARVKAKAQTNNLKGNAPGTGTGSIAGLNATQNNVARQLMGEFTQAGMSRAGAAGMIGNAAQESSLNASEPGGYLFQWGGQRLGSLVSYAASMGKPPSNVSAQAAYAVHELKTGYASLWSMLKTTNDPAAAATAICNQWERPLASAANLPHRIAAAQEAYKSLGAGAGVVDTAVSAVTTATTLAGDLLSGNFADLGARLAMVGVTIAKDIVLGFADFVVIPWWHWNQRAIMYYYQEELVPTTNKTWTVLPWTAVFWGFGYYLLFTDPDGNLKPAPVRNSRLTRHVRSTQALPARRSLIKPKDVRGKTPAKPKPVLSRSLVTETGTMRVSRNLPVKVTGEHVGNGAIRSETPVQREGTLHSEAQNKRYITGSEPDSHNRTGDNSLPHSGGVSKSPANQGGNRRSVARRRRVS